MLVTYDIPHGFLGREKYKLRSISCSLSFLCRLPGYDNVKVYNAVESY